MKGIKEFKAKDFGLKPIAAAEFGPLIFINLNPDAKKEELKESFLEVYNRLDERQFNVRIMLLWLREAYFDFPFTYNKDVHLTKFLTLQKLYTRNLLFS